MRLPFGSLSEFPCLCAQFINPHIFIRKQPVILGIVVNACVPVGRSSQDCSTGSFTEFLIIIFFVWYVYVLDRGFFLGRGVLFKSSQERRLVRTRLDTAGGVASSAAAAVRIWRYQSCVRAGKMRE